MPARLRERAPRVERTDKGDMWIFDGGKGKWPVGLTTVAGLSFFDYKPMGFTYETIRPGSFDTKARLADMDADGIYAQILYPSVTLKGAKIYSDDRELQTLCVRAYNEWLLEFCSGSGGRLIGQAILPTTGIDDAIAELEFAIAERPPRRGDLVDAERRLRAHARGRPLLGARRGGRLPDRDPHRQLRARRPGAQGHDAGRRSPSSAPRRSPRPAGRRCPSSATSCSRASSSASRGLKIVLVESNIGWIPTLLEQSDDMFMRYRWYTGAVNEQKEMPSTIFFRNFWATFMVDTVGMDLRHRMNVDHLMWSTDYPHSGSDWPNSRLTIERVFRDVPKAEVKKMLHTNCKQLYRLDHVPDRLPGR